MKGPTVRVKQGILRGDVGVDAEGCECYKFLGIPYAEPPLGNLRFKAPRPPQSWNGIRDATTEGAECYSKDPVFHHVVGSEDCLFLNVYLPICQLPINGDGKKPVMVWIHGGGFNAGSSKSHYYGPEFLLTQDVILITFNYRVGVLGFLRFEDSKLGVSGNAGLKDVVMALRWVQENVDSFGGDRDNVTVFGQSAGAAAAHCLLLSPMAKGLFHKVILQSGCALNSWTRGRNAIAKEMANELGCADIQDERQLLLHLQKTPVEQLFEAQEKLRDIYYACELRPNGLTIENKDAVDSFLSEEPREILRSGKYNKVPILMGYTTREGMIIGMFDKKTAGDLRVVDDLETAVPIALGLQRGSPLSKIVANRIKNFYFGSDEPGSHNLDKYYMMHTDNFFLRDIYESVKGHLRTSNEPLYFYRFSLETELNVYKRLGELTLPGVCHSDDLGYIFKNAVTPSIHPGSIEDISIKRITKLWTNFARYGNPNVAPTDRSLVNIKWKPVVDPNKINFLDFGENLTAGVNPEQERMKFWEELYRLDLQSIKSKL